MGALHAVQEENATRQTAQVWRLYRASFQVTPVKFQGDSLVYIHALKKMGNMLVVFEEKLAINLDPGNLYI